MGRRRDRERVDGGLEVAGLTIPEHEPHDAGLEAEIGRLPRQTGAEVGTPSSLPANCMPAKKARQVVSTDWGLSRQRRYISSVTAPFSLNIKDSVAKGRRRYS